MLYLNRSSLEEDKATDRIVDFVERDIIIITYDFPEAVSNRFGIKEDRVVDVGYSPSGGRIGRVRHVLDGVVKQPDKPKYVLLPPLHRILAEELPNYEEKTNYDANFGHLEQAQFFIPLDKDAMYRSLVRWVGGIKRITEETDVSALLLLLEGTIEKPYMFHIISMAEPLRLQI